MTDGEQFWHDKKKVDAGTPYGGNLLWTQTIKDS